MLKAFTPIRCFRTRYEVLLGHCRIWLPFSMEPLILSGVEWLSLIPKQTKWYGVTLISTDMC